MGTGFVGSVLRGVRDVNGALAVGLCWGFKWGVEDREAGKGVWRYSRMMRKYYKYDWKPLCYTLGEYRGNTLIKRGIARWASKIHSHSL